MSNLEGTSRSSRERILTPNMFSYPRLPVPVPVVAGFSPSYCGIYSGMTAGFPLAGAFGTYHLPNQQFGGTYWMQHPQPVGLLAVQHPQPIPAFVVPYPGLPAPPTYSISTSRDETYRHTFGSGFPQSVFYNDFLLPRKLHYGTPMPPCLYTEMSGSEAVRRMEEYLKSDDFTSLEFIDVFNILRRDDLPVSSEKVVFNALMKWLFARENRWMFNLKGLLRCVRLPLLPFHFLEEDVLSNSVIKRDGHCIELTEQAMRYRRLNARERNESKRSGEIDPTFATRRTSYGPSKLLYVFGGICGRDNSVKTSVEYYDFQNETWTGAGDMPTSRTGAAVTAYESQVWIVGGYCDGKGSKDTEIGPEATVHILNPKSSEWSEGPRLRRHRFDFGLGVLEGKLYAVGGSDGREALSSIEIYSPTANSWSLGVPMKEARISLGVAVAARRLYVAGGYKENGEILNQMEFYTPMSDQWSLISGRIRRMKWCDVAVADEIIYVLGGDGSSVMTAYNPISRRWCGAGKIEDIEIERGAVAAIEGRVYVAGGEINGKAVDTVSCYEPEFDMWLDLLKPMKKKRSNARVAVVDK